MQQHSKIPNQNLQATNHKDTSLPNQAQQQQSLNPQTGITQRETKSIFCLLVLGVFCKMTVALVFPGKSGVPYTHHDPGKFNHDSSGCSSPIQHPFHRHCTKELHNIIVPSAVAHESLNLAHDISEVNDKKVCLLALLMWRASMNVSQSVLKRTLKGLIPVNALIELKQKWNFKETVAFKWHFSNLGFRVKARGLATPPGYKDSKGWGFFAFFSFQEYIFHLFRAEHSQFLL